MADQATDGPETFGPYDTEQDTTDSPLIRELRAIWPAGSKAEAAITKQHLGKALSSAYVTLGSLDARTLNWLIRFEPHHVQVIIGLISRAYAAGLSRGGEQA